MSSGENNTRDTSSNSDQNITPGQDIYSDIGNIWVRNLFKTPLTKAQEHVLAHRPNFTIVPKVPPVMEYIAAIQKACQQLKEGEVEELRGEIKLIIKKIPPSKPNISKDEHQAIQQLKKDTTRMVLTADKGVCLVVVDKEDYIKKSEELLLKPAYKILPSDPTAKHKNKLITLLKSIKAQGEISENTYKRLYPTGACSPKYYGLPKVHKIGIPLRPIVSSIGSVSYETAKELSKILEPLFGKTSYSVKNTKDFIQSIKDIRLQKDECMVLYYVKALFTSVPTKSSIAIIQRKLEEDKDLHLRTTMSAKQITSLLEFCLNNTYFAFQGKFYEQVDGTAMGSTISPIVANLFMEDLDTRALAISPHPLSLWKRFVDDTFTIIKKSHKDAFLDHINSIDNNIRFTCEESRDDGSIPFLDILIIPEEDGRLNTTVYRKPTHTDLYLQLDSHHNIPSKYSVIGTLYHRAKTICSSPQHLQKE